MSCPGNGEAVCNGNGQCDLTTGSCICNTGFEGAQCEGLFDNKCSLVDVSCTIKSILAMSCPGNGESTCNGNGRCDLTTGSCICNTGFEGPHCEG
mgnify:CR=1 FL=1